MLNPYLKSSNIEDKSNLKLRSYNFSLSIINYCSFLPNNRPCWIIEDQLIRSATSVGANMVEAKSSSSKRDFIHFYEISLKSANETEYWLWLLHDSGIVGIDVKKLEELIIENDEISKMLAKSLLTMKNKTKF